MLSKNQGDQESRLMAKDARRAIQMGSKSFALASHLLGRDCRDDVLYLYAWCRHCDDEADSSQWTDGRGEGVTADVAINRLWERSEAALRGDERALSQPSYTAAAEISHRRAASDWVFVGLARVVHARGIPHHYVRELLEGMRMDLTGAEYETESDLLLYCYRVAGVVGLMMTHILGVSDARALKNAQDMGTAMQLTNIARDLVSDAGVGRLYVPREWLIAEGLPVTPHELEHSQHRERLARIAQRLVALASRYYDSGVAGIPALPFRAALAVSVAREVYGGIGDAVVRRGARAWDKRTWVDSFGKFWLTGRGIWRVVRDLPARLSRKWQRVPLNEVRYFQSS